MGYDDKSKTVVTLENLIQELKIMHEALAEIKERLEKLESTAKSSQATRRIP